MTKEIYRKAKPIILPKWEIDKVLSGGKARLIRGDKVVGDFKVGDVLWVKERYREFSGMNYVWSGGAYTPAYAFSGVEYFADGKSVRTDEGCMGELFVLCEDMRQDVDYEKWLPASRMSKKYARIFICVKSVTETVTEVGATLQSFLDNERHTVVVVEVERIEERAV